jgi:ribosome-associated protein
VKKTVGKKPVASKPVAKKTAAKKPVAVKAVGKKAVSKKTIAKKPVAPKTAAKKPVASKKAVVAHKAASKKPVARAGKKPVISKTAAKKPVATKKPVVVQKAKGKTPVAPKATAKKNAPAKKPLPRNKQSAQNRAPTSKEPAVQAPAETTEAVATVETAPIPSADPILLQRILTSLDDDKAEEITTIDLAGRSSLCDAIVVASGRSSRHVASIAEHLARRLKEAGYGTRPVNGAGQGDWALVDAGDVIVHIFRPEVRSYYDLEGMWSVDESKLAKASK